MIGSAPAFQMAMRLLDRFATCDATVLIEGETGTGKELAARRIHYRGARADGPFIPVNCGAIPEQLVESELFGHRRGAFTDAKEAAAGILALAEGGTLFLDEVDSLCTKAQISLLRFLQERTIRRIGEAAERHVNVRLVAACNCDLEALARRGLFRMDLFYRLNIMHILLPPLRERRNDIAMLADHFLRVLVNRYGAGPSRLDQESANWLAVQPWPGNVRQLQNFLEREFLLAEQQMVLRISALMPTGECPLGILESDERWNYARAKAHLLETFNRDYLGNLMRSSGGNISLAARKSGKERRDLGRMLRKYRIEAELFRDSHSQN